MNIVTDNTGLIISTSTGRPTPPDGGALYELTDAQEAAWRTVAAQPNGGITFDGESFSALPAPPPPVPVVSASPAQFREELMEMGKMDAVQALIAQQDAKTQSRFEYATEFRSNSPLLLALAAHPTIGMTEQDVIDALTRAAARDIGV